MLPACDEVRLLKHAVWTQLLVRIVVNTARCRCSRHLFTEVNLTVGTPAGINAKRWRRRLAHVTHTCALVRVTRTCALARFNSICALARFNRTCGLARVNRTCALARVTRTCDLARVTLTCALARVTRTCALIHTFTWLFSGRQRCAHVCVARSEHACDVTALMLRHEFEQLL